LPFKATAGTMPVWNDEGKPVATLFYVYYERTDVRNKAERPLVFSFNGGPGSASVWMHLAYTGPYHLQIDSEGYPLQPYGYQENPHSILDVADIVYIDPANTGYSRIVDPEAKREQFFGVNQDVRYLSEWIQAFVTRNNRWLSPKYLIGESYGTTRVSGLAQALQGNGIYREWGGARVANQPWHRQGRTGCCCQPPALFRGNRMVSPETAGLICKEKNLAEVLLGRSGRLHHERIVARNGKRRLD
jgi:carboxypeptidase C (cathepsin A)